MTETGWAAPPEHRTAGTRHRRTTLIPKHGTAEARHRRSTLLPKHDTAKAAHSTAAQLAPPRPSRREYQHTQSRRFPTADLPPYTPRQRPQYRSPR